MDWSTQYPPGLMGDIARYIFAQAPKPVFEVAMCGAMGLMSGICGRTFTVHGAGTNTYTLLISPTGRGKEAMSDGIDKLVTAVGAANPAIRAHIGPATFTREGLTSYLAKQSPCFVSVSAEFALTLKQLAVTTDPRQAAIRRALLQLYTASGLGKSWEPPADGRLKKQPEPIQCPAFSLLAETEPSGFFETLDKPMISSGLLPRFMVVVHDGPRPPTNMGHYKIQPSPELVAGLSDIVSMVENATASETRIECEFTAEAMDMFVDLNAAMDDRINSGSSDYAELWNRAGMKVAKLAALASVGVNYAKPLITKELMEFAQYWVERDTLTLIKRYESEIAPSSNVENMKRHHVKRVMRELYEQEWSRRFESQNVTRAFHKDRACPLNFLQKRTARMSVFRRAKNGPTDALYVTLASMIKEGDIIELPLSLTQERFNYSGRMFVFPEALPFR